MKVKLTKEQLKTIQGGDEIVQWVNYKFGGDWERAFEYVNSYFGGDWYKAFN